MPIDIQCNDCKKRFRVPEKFGGRRIKCPNCQEPIVVRAAGGAEGDSGNGVRSEQPAADSVAGSGSGSGSGPGVAVGTGSGAMPARARQAARPEISGKPGAEAGPDSGVQIDAAEEGQWYMQTDDGEQYGPVDREELDAWVAEGRIDGTCQLLCDGWDQWKWADEVYPDLDEEASTEDGFVTVRGDSSKAIGPVVAMRSDTRLKARAAPSDASTGGIQRILTETRPWVLLMAIVGLVGAGLGGLIALVSLILSAVALALPGILLSLVMAATYGLAGWAAFHLLVYAQRIQAYVASSGTAELERALVAQRSFWRLAGIVTLVATGIWVLGVLLLLILMLAGAAVLTA